MGYGIRGRTEGEIKSVTVQDRRGVWCRFCGGPIKDERKGNPARRKVYCSLVCKNEFWKQIRLNGKIQIDKRKIISETGGGGKGLNSKGEYTQEETSIKTGGGGDADLEYF